MSDWKIIEKFPHLPTNAAMNLASLGTYGLLGRTTYCYVIEHVETGETKRVLAEDEHELGDIIAEGDFQDADDD
jgi:hypothetical protein